MHNYTSKSDVEIVNLTLKDQEVFLHLVQRYEGKLSRYIRRIAFVDTQTVEDILQEVFIKIYKIDIGFLGIWIIKSNPFFCYFFNISKIEFTSSHFMKLIFNPENLFFTRNFRVDNNWIYNSLPYKIISFKCTFQSKIPSNIYFVKNCIYHFFRGILCIWTMKFFRIFYVVISFKNMVLLALVS